MDKWVIEFETKTPKIHSTRWDSNDKDAVMSTIYLRKPASQSAKKLRVTIEEVD